MKYLHNPECDTYTAPLLGNGEVSLSVSPDGSMNPVGGKSIVKASPSRCIFWEGRRYRCLANKNLIPFGRFTQKLSDASGELSPSEMTQELDTQSAQIICEALYPDGSRIGSALFLHTDFNLIAVKKTFEPESPLVYTFTYSFCGKGDDDTLPDFTEAEVRTDSAGGKICYRLTDQKDCRGVISLFCDADAEVAGKHNSISLTLKIDSPRTVCFYILLSDCIDHDDPAAFAKGKRAYVLSEGFDRLKAVHGKAWSDYYAEGGASLGDELLDRVYMTAQYHMRCFTTKWSMPVGLYDTCWDGRFFAFDEHYMFLGLLTSNHMDAAVRVPRFRKAGLPIAVKRFSSRHHNAAYYPWETLEDGTEAAPAGFWFEHIFHMATITLTEYYYYLYSGDEEFLRETAYPVMSACTEFFRIHALYRVEGGKLIVGKCTDLERLGSSVENAYMTTCGVIAAFRAYAGASRRLNQNLPLADECERLADELTSSLPSDGKRYVPYPGCEERSISAFSGTFPFPAIDRNDPLQTQAIDDYLLYEDAFGNMYAVGSGICSWYACWKSVAYSRLRRSSDACGALEYVAKTAGNFGEMFEINNEASRTYTHPWFTTAAGMYVHAMNELLLDSDGEDIYIAPALDEKYDSFSFRLAARGGLVVCATAKDGKLTGLRVSANGHCALEQVRVHVPSRFDASGFGADGGNIIEVKVTRD